MYSGQAAPLSNSAALWGPLRLGRMSQSQLVAQRSFQRTMKVVSVVGQVAGLVLTGALLATAAAPALVAVACVSVGLLALNSKVSTEKLHMVQDELGKRSSSQGLA